MIALIGLFLLLADTTVEAVNIFSSDFDWTAGGFAYSDNSFRGTTTSQYASGKHVGGSAGVSSFLQVELGGVDNSAVTNGMSGGWSRDFVLSQSAAVSIEIDYRLVVGAEYEPDEFAQVLCSIDGVLIGLNSKDFVHQIFGDGPGGNDIAAGYTTVTLTSRVLTSGSHRITIGGFNNKKTTQSEVSRVRFNKVSVSTIAQAPVKIPTRAPIKLPTRAPTKVPVKLPTRAPTKVPVKLPSRAPTKLPIKSPTRAPTKVPVKLPARTPTKLPIKSPTRAPTKVPFKLPTRMPTKAPTKLPTRVPTKAPIKLPTRTPTKAPIILPATLAPTKAPMKLPTMSPTSSPVKLPTQAPTKAPIHSQGFSLRISAGADVNFMDMDGTTWERDQFFGNKGGVYGNCPLQIAGTLLDEIYCKERYFNIWQHAQPFRYDIPVPRSGVYTVKLHFAETFHRTIGSRVFDVWASGSLAFKGLDIVAEVGFETALVTSTVVQVTNGVVSIEFVPKIENPKICAIEVIEIPNYIAPPTSAPIAVRFKSVLINCGGDEYVETSGERTWSADKYFIGGSTYSDGSNGVNQTLDDRLYQSERNGEFRYEIPVPVGSYEVLFHLTELYWQGTGQRLFDITIEDTVAFKNVDMVKLGGGSRLQAFTLESPVTIVDGFLSISFSSSNPKVDNPSLSAIEVNFLEPHLAHSVANGPYIATDISNAGSADVIVDGSFSHSHATGAEIVQWTWKEGSAVVGVGSLPTLRFSVGTHTVTLTVKDNLNNDATDTTTITVNPFGYPTITGVNPIIGGVAGGQTITILGAGFDQISSAVKVFFGNLELSSTSITILNQFTIEVITPPTTVAAPVLIKVQTPLGTSNSMIYTYQTSSPINFNSNVLTRDIASPTSAAFGPDGLLYVGTLFGTLARIQLDSSYTQVLSTVTSVVAPFRAILGIAFDPLQTSGLSDVFITTSFFFHGSPLSSGGQGINGNVKKISGSNLDVITDIVTGLPVSDHDHGLTGLEYGDNGEIYIQCASNTNGGIPGRLTGKQVQKDNFYSSATVVAHLADPLFNGAITYTADDDGVPNGGRGIEVFASGTRNPFGICIHSNGNIYASDNGPNFSYGDMMTGCQPGESRPDVTEGDKINLLVEGGYYGAPNKIRALATNDPRQCVWRSQYEPSGGGYTAPILNTPSSTDGLIEFHGDHFEKQLRGNLIAAKYQGSLLRIILTPDGKGVIPQSDPAIQLSPDVDALDITQAPDGTLISTSLDQNALYFHKPIETPTTKLQIKSVYPRRGGQIGGNTLMIFGENFGTVTRIVVGGRECNLTSRSNSRMECIVPGGSGTVDIVVSGADTISYNFERGYRYVTGLPA